MPQKPARGLGGPALLVDEAGTPYSQDNPLPVSGAPGGQATIDDGADVAQGAKADAAETDPPATTTIVALPKGLRQDLHPPAHSEAVDLSSTDYTPDETTRAIIVGVAGDVKVDTADGQSGVTIPLPAGQWSMKLTKIYKVGTDA